MFDPKMLAPCGLNCALCKRALQKERPCQGCRGPLAYKSNYCLTKCTIWICAKLADTDGFCDQCPDYPCEQVMEKEIRYAETYPLTESPIQNLRAMRKDGMAAFLKAQEQQWRCVRCGATMCVHTGKCAKCGFAADKRE
jgi:ribosomal protein L37E